jgi:hypothetical protein
LLLLIGAIFMMPTSAALAKCMKYGPTVVVTGRIVARTNYGPPNYGEDPAHDSKEKQLYVKLAAPICVDARDDEQAVAGVRLIQLIYCCEFRRDWIGKRMSVRGTLLPWETGHHHTPVLIEISETRFLRNRTSN